MLGARLVNTTEVHLLSGILLRQLLHPLVHCPQPLSLHLLDDQTTSKVGGTECEERESGLNVPVEFALFI